MLKTDLAATFTMNYSAVQTSAKTAVETGDVDTITVATVNDAFSSDPSAFVPGSSTGRR